MKFSREKLNTKNNPDKQKFCIIIPKNEYIINYILSSGPGGQNVNRRKTCAELFFPVFESQTLTYEQGQKLINNYPYSHEISEKGIIRITAQEERSQEQNRKRAIEKLHENINMALRPKKKRKTKKPARIRNKQARDRKKFKQKRAEKKSRRKRPEIPK